MGGGGVCGRGEKGGAFCSVCIFHNQKMHVYLIFCCSLENAHSRLFLAYEYVEYDVVMDRKMLKSIQYDYC